MLFRALSIAALIGIIGSSTASAGGRLSSSGIKFAGSPTAGRLTSSVIKKETATVQGVIVKMGRTAIQGRMVRRGGCEDWGCGSTNGTKLTGIVQETVAATEAVVTGVMLPSGEAIDLR